MAHPRLAEAEAEGTWPYIPVRGISMVRPGGQFSEKAVNWIVF